MFWTKKVVIGDGERGLVYRDRRFARLLMPGVYRLFDPLHRLTITLHAVGNGAPVGAEAERLIEALGPQLETHCVLADIGAHQVGLLLRNGVLDGVLPPGSRTLYWRGATPVRAGAAAQRWAAGANGCAAPAAPARHAVEGSQLR